MSREEREVETSPYEYEPSSDGSMPPSGTADTRSSNADATSPHHPLPADNTGSISHSEEVYRLEWFSALVVMLLLFLCELIVFLLVFQTTPGLIQTGYNFQGLVLQTAMGCSMIWSGVIFYTGIFVFLTEYHNAVGKFLDRFLFLRGRVQPMCLRVVAYSYCVSSLLAVAFFLYPSLQVD